MNILILKKGKHGETKAIKEKQNQESEDTNNVETIDDVSIVKTNDLVVENEIKETNNEELKEKIGIFKKIYNKILETKTSINLKIEEEKLEKMILSGQIVEEDYMNGDQINFADFLSPKMLTCDFAIKYKKKFIYINPSRINVNKKFEFFIGEDEEHLELVPHGFSLYISRLGEDFRKISAGDVYDLTGFSCKGLILSKAKKEQSDLRYFSELVS